jgi:hypothetical protein
MQLCLTQLSGSAAVTVCIHTMASMLKQAPAQAADSEAQPAAPAAEAVAALGAAWAGASADTCALRGGEVAHALATMLAPGRGLSPLRAWVAAVKV